MTVYHARPIKPRKRSTRAEMEARRECLYDTARELRPISVRGLFYQMVNVGLVEKTDNGYAQIQSTLAEMRRTGLLPYHWIADNTRWQRRPPTWADSREALRQTTQSYRRSLVSAMDAYVEVWLEKDALAGVVLPVTEEFDVPLMVSRGYASLSFLASAAECIAEQAKPVYLYHLGDLDPSGVNAGEKIEETLRELAPNADIHFRRLAVTRDQADAWDLPTRPTKATDSRAKRFRGESVELDAVSPDLLRDLVRLAVESHVDWYELKTIRVAEESERTILSSLFPILEKRLARSQRSTPA